MTLNIHKHLNINNKDVYVVESHHHALLAWCYIRRELPHPPNLISLDHHTDTMPAFNSFRCGGESFDIAEDHAEALEPLIAALKWEDDNSVINAIGNLRYDEHIHAATLANIINYGFAINLSSQTPSKEESEYQERTSHYMEEILAGKIPHIIERPKALTYEVPENRIFEISADCAINCKTTPHDDRCLIIRADQVIESFYLDHELTQANVMSHSIGYSSIESEPYILDIDLDYFHSEKSINPDDSNTFYRLIRNAKAITIAMEYECVEELKVEGSLITSDSLLKSLLNHITKATC